MKIRDDDSEQYDASDLNHESYVLGDAAFLKGQFSKAKNYFLEALEHWPEDHAAWWALGNCYDELNKSSKAEESFRKAIEYANADALPSLYYNLGNSLFDQRRYSNSIEAYEKVPKGHKVWPATKRNLISAKAELKA